MTAVPARRGAVRKRKRRDRRCAETISRQAWSVRSRAGLCWRGGAGHSFVDVEYRSWTGSSRDGRLPRTGPPAPIPRAGKGRVLRDPRAATGVPVTP